MVYVLFMTFELLCPTSTDQTLSFMQEYCPDYEFVASCVDYAKEEYVKGTVMYNWLVNASIVFTVLLFVEASIYLAFYKDVIFSMGTLLVFSSIILMTVENFEL